MESVHTTKLIKRKATDFVGAESKSGLLVRLEVERRTIGVLGLESANENWFDHEDKEVLRLFAGHAAEILAVTSFEDALHDLEQKVILAQGATNNVLRPILKEIDSLFGFDGGIIYVPSLVDDEEVLKAVCVMHPDKSLERKT